jgi:ribosomal protein S18 acetylase RimI-like enzyme
VFVAMSDGRIVGSVTLELRARLGDEEHLPPLASSEANVRMLGVDPEFRRMGVARALTNHCIFVARNAGKEKITLHTSESNTDAQEFYESLSFIRVNDVIVNRDFQLRTYELGL